MKVLTKFQGELLKEHNRTRKQLRSRLKHRLAPEIIKAIIKDSINALTARQAPIIAVYIYREYKKGLADAKRELKGVNIKAAAPIPDMGNIGMDLDEVSQQQMNRIFHTNLGAIGNYNEKLSKTLQTQYNKLLSDNKLIGSLNRDGWTPWLDETLKKRGVSPVVIDLIKGQKTSQQMINILELHGIKGGMHPNHVAKRLLPHINRFFGPEGVSINNIGKIVKQFRIDADGNYGWFDHKITKIYKATPRTYSRLIARDTLRHARMDAYYDSLKGSKRVDHYISIAHMDSTTCGMCASMHGRRVAKGSGPLYHGNCGCDLRPVWKKDSPLASQNKPEAFFEKQRNMHFLRMHDLKRYNAKMPRGMKLKYATQLPEDAITKVMPGNIKMRAIRHEMLGGPKKITPAVVKVKAAEKVKATRKEAITRKLKKQPWGMSDAEWKKEAKKLYGKTAKDGVEHAKTFDDDICEYIGKASEISYQSPYDDHWAMHTHPGWDSPLSGNDFLNFLFTPSKRVSVAASKEHIYLLRKTPDIRAPPSDYAFVEKFNRAWNAAAKRIRFKMPAQIMTAEDQRQLYITLNKQFGKKYGFEYKIIDR